MNSIEYLHDLLSSTFAWVQDDGAQDVLGILDAEYETERVMRYLARKKARRAQVLKFDDGQIHICVERAMRFVK
jgi:hypothetical protein